MPQVEFGDICPREGSLWAEVSQFDKCLRVGISERLEQNSVRHREDGRIHADRNRDQQYSYRRESRCLCERSKCEA